MCLNGVKMGGDGIEHVGLSFPRLVCLNTSTLVPRQEGFCLHLLQSQLYAVSTSSTIRKSGAGVNDGVKLKIAIAMKKPVTR